MTCNTALPLHGSPPVASMRWNSSSSVHPYHGTSSTRRQTFLGLAASASPGRRLQSCASLLALGMGAGNPFPIPTKNIVKNRHGSIQYPRGSSFIPHQRSCWVRGEKESDSLLKCSTSSTWEPCLSAWSTQAERGTAGGRAADSVALSGRPLLL